VITRETGQDDRVFLGDLEDVPLVVSQFDVSIVNHFDAQSGMNVE